MESGFTKENIKSRIVMENRRILKRNDREAKV